MSPCPWTKRSWSRLTSLLTIMIFALLRFAISTAVMGGMVFPVRLYSSIFVLKRTEP